MFRTLKKMKEEKQELKNEINRLTIKERLLKTNCCDFCMNEIFSFKRESSKSNNPIYFIQLPNTVLKMCEEHAKILKESLNDILEQSE